MALVKCKECGAQISSEAKACTQCGKEVAKTSGCLMAIIFIGVISGVGAIVNSCSDAQRANEEGKAAAIAADAEKTRRSAMTPEQRATEDKKRADAAKLAAIRDTQLAKSAATRKHSNLAASACQIFVERSLHDPSSAQFEDSDTYWRKEERPGLFHVQVNVRAKNGFNAYRSMIVDCYTKFDGTNFLAVSLKQQ